jgi:thymidylate synthase (FAD)
LGKNKNISKVRDVYSNLLGTIESGHGSVFSHCQLNFVARNVSRIETHEHVRHGIGTAYSQTSGRYVRNEELDIIVDPILEPIYEEVEEARLYLQNWYKRAEDKIGLNTEKSFDRKKKITSALRRLMPNGQSNELGFSVNLRALRHMIELRTSGHAEWEIREVFNQVYDLVKVKYPAIFHDSSYQVIDGLKEITFKNKKI